MTPVSYPSPPPTSPWRPAPPPAAPNGQPLADFGNRALAFIIDYAIYYGVYLVLTLPFLIWWMFVMFEEMNAAAAKTHVDSAAFPFDFSRFWLPFLAYFAASILVSLGFTYLYFVEYQLRKGQTIGKRVMGSRIIPVDPNATLTRGHLVKRWAVEWVAASFVPFLMWIDGLWQLWDKPLQQCLHDKAAGTVVVKAG